MEKPEILSIKKCPWSAHKTITFDSENSGDILISQVGDARMMVPKSVIMCTAAELILFNNLDSLDYTVVVRTLPVPIKDWMWLGSNSGSDAP